MNLRFRSSGMHARSGAAGSQLTLLDHRGTMVSPSPRAAAPPHALQQRASIPVPPGAQQPVPSPVGCRVPPSVQSAFPGGRTLWSILLCACLPSEYLPWRNVYSQRLPDFKLGFPWPMGRRTSFTLVQARYQIRDLLISPILQVIFSPP